MSGAVDMALASWPDIEAAVKRGAMAVLPVGATEQHGAHLPLTTDTDLAGEVARRLADALGAILLPPVTYGEAWNNSAFPGTLSVRPETLRAMVEDIGSDVAGMGARALITLNGHFGNKEPIALASRVLSEKLPVLNLDYPNLEKLATAICDSDPAGPGFFHADEVETAMMLAVRPEAVDMGRATPEYPEFPGTFGSEPMQLRVFNASGVFGDPRPATAEKGELLFDGITAGALEIIEQFKVRHDL